MTDVPGSDRSIEYIKACLGAKLKQQPLPIPPENLDWDLFLQNSARHRLAGLFAAWGVKDQAPWPAHVIQRLRQERVQRMLYGQAYGTELSGVLSALQAAGIPVIVLKGWALIQSLYGGDPSRRLYSDTDLLIPARLADQGEQVLLSLGYTALPDEPCPGYNRRYGANIPFRSPHELAPIKGRVMIELHWGLIHVPFFANAIDYDGMFARARSISVAGTQALELDPVDTLIHLCAHQELHHSGEDRLARDYELAAWIYLHKDQIDWQCVVERAQQWRLGRAVQRALERVEGLWAGSILPEGVVLVRGMRQGLVERTLLLMEAAEVDLLRVIEIFASLPFQLKFRYLFETTFPSRAFLRHRYGEAPFGFWPLLYFTRLGKSLERIPLLFARH